jgi:type II secretory pathway pseudopilin PulG
MEMLVALGVFSMIMSMGIDIYMLTGRTQRKVFNLERLQSDARFAMEAMTREVRTGSIDYAYYGTTMARPESTLALVSSDNTRLRFHKSDSTNETACGDTNSRPCLLVTVGDGDAAAITPKGTKVTSLGFYIAPDLDPFYFGTTGWQNNVQPHVTMVLGLQSVGNRVGETVNINLQTTATSRAYRR